MTGKWIVPALALMLASPLTVISTAGASQPLSSHGGANRPNVVFIMTDDLDARSVYQLLLLDRMPNLKQHILAGGMVFPNAFVTNSICCPSRATTLTGQYNHNNGVLANSPPLGGVAALDDSSTLGTWLQEAGYYTGYQGKYLNGYGFFGVTANPFDPMDERYVPPGWDQWFGLIDPTSYWMYGFSINHNGILTQYGESADDYQTDVLADLAEDFLSTWKLEAPDQPFFLMVNPLAPHGEICPGIIDPKSAECRNLLGDPFKVSIRPAPRHLDDPEIYALPLPRTGAFNEEDISDKPAWLQIKHSTLLTQQNIDDMTNKYRDRLASLLAVDDLVGSIVTALGPHYANTAFVFTSDNGFLLGQHRLHGKEYVYEDAIRVPVIMKLPSAPVANSSQRLVLNTDWAATFIQLLGLTPPLNHAIDGRSFLHLYFADAQAQFRNRFLIEHWPKKLEARGPVEYSAVRTDRLSDPNFPHQVYTVYRYPPEFGGGVEREHYDMTQDPDQALNLYDAVSGPTAGQLELENYVDALKNCAGLTCQYWETID